MNAYELAKLMLDVTDCETSEYYQAGMMLKHQADYIAQLEKGLESSIAMNKAQAERQELTDSEIADLIKATNDETGFGHIRIFDFVKSIAKKDTREMNNEPVAWMKTLPDGTVYGFGQTKTNDEFDIPLYTNPKKYCPSENNQAYEKGFIDGMAKMTESAVHRAVEGMAVKELTDEEIAQEWSKFYPDVFHTHLLEFVRAILRKAQEK